MRHAGPETPEGPERSGGPGAFAGLSLRRRLPHRRTLIGGVWFDRKTGKRVYDERCAERSGSALGERTLGFWDDSDECWGGNDAVVRRWAQLRPERVGWSRRRTVHQECWCEPSTTGFGPSANDNRLAAGRSLVVSSCSRCRVSLSALVALPMRGRAGRNGRRGRDRNPNGPRRCFSRRLGRAAAVVAFEPQRLRRAIEPGHPRPRPRVDPPKSSSLRRFKVFGIDVKKVPDSIVTLASGSATVYPVQGYSRRQNR